MKKLLLFALLVLAGAGPASATPAAAAQVQADDPVQMTYEQAYAFLVFELGFDPADAEYILTHSSYYYALLAQIAAYEGLLPYHP